MSGNSWLEQDWVYEWAKKHNIEADRKALLEIMEKMTEPRIELQDIRIKLNRYFEENNMV
jgi:hypothetical protein